MWIRPLVGRAKEKLFAIPKLRKIKPQRMLVRFSQIDRQSPLHILANVVRRGKVDADTCVVNDETMIPFGILCGKSIPRADEANDQRLLVNAIQSKHYFLLSFGVKSWYRMEALWRQINYFQISQTNQSSAWLIADRLWKPEHGAVKFVGLL